MALFRSLGTREWFVKASKGFQFYMRTSEFYQKPVCVMLAAQYSAASCEFNPCLSWSQDPVTEVSVILMLIVDNFNI